MLEILLSRAQSKHSAFRSRPNPNGSVKVAKGDASPNRDRRSRFLYAPVRPVSLARFVPNVLDDQKRIWLFPKAVFQGRHWKPVLIFLVLTGGLLLVDPHDPGYFRHTKIFHGFNEIVSGQNAADMMWVVALSVLGIGIFRQDPYMRHTSFYAIQAVVDSEIVTQVLKGIDRRLRPQDVHSYHHLLDSWFQDKGHWYSGPGSFPSGHMIAAMSLATVFALRYSDRRWVPGVAYGLAGVIGFSRLTLLSHFPSDVFAGGVFGYVISRYVVLRPEGLQAAPSSESESRETARVEALP